jgi:hypothetical protein
MGNGGEEKGEFFCDKKMLSFAFKDSIFFMKIMSHLRVDLLFSL